MSTKVYANGNYIFLDKGDGSLILFDAKGNVLVQKIQDNPAKFRIKSPVFTEDFLLSDLTNESGTPYNAATWEAFYVSNTGFNFASADNVSGWGDYSDTVYTEGSPFSLGTSDGKVTLPNNAGTKLESQKPSDVTTFYDESGQVITGRNGDGILITLEFYIKPDGAGSNPRVATSIDIGGSVGEIYPTDFIMSKGNGVEHYFLSSFGGYTLDTWEANGGTVKVQAFNEDLLIYNVRYVITRTHKAR